MLDLNNPDTRESALRERLSAGDTLIVAALAEELGISVHTIRRDLIALEQKGLVRRVRGGAVPITDPSPDYLSRIQEENGAVKPIADRAAALIPSGGTVFIDAGTTMDAVAKQLPRSFRGLIVTPAPSVALLAMERGASVHLIGGSLCPSGAMTTGGEAERAISDVAGDMCLLGACGLWPAFGLSAEDGGEAGVKRAMARAATRAVVVTSAAKFDRRGNHRVLSPEEIDTIVTDADAKTTEPFTDAGVEIIHV